MIRKIAILLAFIMIMTGVMGCESRVGMEGSSSSDMPPAPSSSAEVPQEQSQSESQSLSESEPEPEQSGIERPPLPPVVNIDGYIDNIASGDVFELPVQGATGYAASDLAVYTNPDSEQEATSFVMAGTGFTIVEDAGEWWYVRSDTREGWVISAYCMINLPDVIPSIIYDNTNTYSSRLKSSGVDIPNVTGQALYQMSDFNDRLGREEYIMPVLYGMASKIATAQQAALAEGNCLIIYEAFRPSMAHTMVHENFSDLFEENESVQAGILVNSFTERFFLAPAPYTHQRGTAIDSSLAKVNATQDIIVGDYFYTAVTDHTEYDMQTDVHELSVASAIYSYPVQSNSDEAWRGVPFTESVTEGSMLMQKYCTDAGLTPLASEWWHFNDLPSTQIAVEIAVFGGYWINNTYSLIPTAE